MNRFNHALLALTSLALFSGSASAQIINVTDTAGRGITAKLVSCDGKNLKIIRQSDSKAFTLPLSGLNGATKGAVKRWMAVGGNLSEIYQVLVDTGKTSRTSIEDDFDDKRVNLTPTITVTNGDSKNPSKPQQLTIFFLGRPVETTTDIYVFRKQSFSLPKIEPLTSKAFEVSAISEAYDNRGSVKFGSRYLGYAWLIHEPDGSRVITSGSIPSSLAEKYKEKLLDLREEGTYNKDLRALD